MKKILLLTLLSVSCCMFGVSLKKDDFTKGTLRGWVEQPYWGGKLKIVTIDGKKYMELVSTPKQGRVFGRSFAPMYSKELYFPTAKIRLEAKVKGKGKLQLGLLKYSFGSGVPAVSYSKAVELTDDFQDYSFNFELDSVYEKVFPLINLEGEGKAVFASFEMHKDKDSKNTVNNVSPLQIISVDAKSAPVIFQTSLKNQDVFVSVISKKAVVNKVKADAAGKVVFPSEKFAPGMYHIFASADGVGDKAYIYSMDAKTFARTDALASKVKLDKKINVLILGDSLSDFYRGYNYVDKFSYWMNKYNPGKFTFHNAGVGGDFLERAYNRMEYVLGLNKKWIYRQEMYRGIFKDVYDYVFIFMGQNDTRCMPKDNYSTPETTPEEQQKYLSLMLQRLKEVCPKAKVVIIAPSPSDEALFDSYLAKGRKLPFYGRKKFVDAYDANNRKFCQENKLDYVNILTPMREYKPLKALYVSDGVHLSDVGGDVIADCLLEYFGR